MVGTISPHAYSKELMLRGGSPELLRQIKLVDFECERHKVTSVYTLTHLCALAKVPYAVAREAIFDHRKHYKTRRLAKKSDKNKFRVIHEPSAPLRALQSAIYAKCLPDTLSSPVSFAFESSRNTLLAARQHVGAKAMIHVDVANFYQSISAKSIYRVFVGLGYPELLSFEMTLLTTVGHDSTLRDPKRVGPIYELHKEGFLPQGAATSGRLSNHVCSTVDIALNETAAKWQGVVTRYADDINLSFSRPISRKDAALMLADLRASLDLLGMNFNSSKTQVIINANQFKMLGLCVGQDSVWLNRHYKSSVRAHLHGLEKYGLSDHAIFRGYKSDLHFMNFIWGHYAYSAGVEPVFGREIKARLAAAHVPRI
jgi:RNA-directed DNA polymerase